MTLKRIILALVVIFSIMFLASCSSMPVSKSVLIEDAPISYVFSENAGPTVVFDAGACGTFNDWRYVFNDVAEYTAAVAYTRSTSAKASDTTTGEDVAYTLKALLEKIKAPKPYVLVGHSGGGMYIRCFAKLFPEDVAGIVLVDSTPKGYLKEAIRLGIDYIPTNIKEYPGHLQAMFRGIDETDEQLPTPAELGNMPVTVIVADKFAKGYEKMQLSWLPLQKEFVEGLMNGRLVEVKGSGHYIHHDRPKIVRKEIRLMVDKIKR